MEKENLEPENNSPKTLPDKSQSNPKSTDLVLDKAMESIKWWNKSATLKKSDSIIISLFKVTFRVIGILIMIALSPIAILFLIITFLAVI